MREVESSVHDRESNLYEQQLETYLSTSLQQGSTPQQLEEYLVSKGYDSQSVRNALNQVNKKYYSGNLEIHKQSHSMNSLLLVGVFLIILALGIFFYFKYSTPYEFGMTLENSELQAGESLEFFMSTTRLVDLEITVSTLKGNLVLQKNDVVETASKYYLNLPDDVPLGKYVVDIIVTYNEEEDHKSFSFTVGKEEVQQDYQEQTQTIPTTITNRGPTSLETFSLAIDSMNSNECETIENNILRDECYFVIARDVPDETICEYIQEKNKKDSCYMTHVLGGTTIRCTILEDDDNVAICESFS